VKRMIAVLCSALLAGLLPSCTNHLAGNGSEVTNGYCVASAAPADSAMVVAYPHDYIPYPPSAGPETTFTDQDGRFSMRLGQSDWNLVIYDKLGARGAFVPLLGSCSTTDTIVLDSVGAINGIINDTLAVARYIGVVGSPFYAGISGRTDTFSLVKLPPSSYTMNLWQIRPTSGDTDNSTINSRVKIIPTATPISVTVWSDSTTAAIINP
jgi:hypothetical protein